MSARGPIQDVLRGQAKWLTTPPDPRWQSATTSPRGPHWLTIAGQMNEAADLIDSLLDPENKLFLRHYSEHVERLEAELAAARAALPFPSETDYQDWLNELMENAGDERDGDEAMEAIALRYVRHLEANQSGQGG